MKDKEIKLIKNNEGLNLSDLEWVKRFYDFLKIENKINPTKAFSIIYYLQEHLPVFPDYIEQCNQCKELFDSYSNGYHSDVTLKHFCDNCYPYGLAEREEKILERKNTKKQSQ